MSLLDNLKRFLYGSPEMMMPGQGMGGGTQGLIGTEGQIGDGLLQNNFSKMNMAEGGLLKNIPDNVLLGAALYGQGIKGKDPLAGAFPAYVQAVKARKLFEPKKTELQKNLEAAGFKSGTPEYAAALQSYLFKGKENSLGKEALALYNESKTVDNFNKWYQDLPGNKKQLWNKYIKGNEDLFMQMLMGSMSDSGVVPDIKTPDLPKLEITNDMIQAVIDANGGNISREEAIKAIEEDYKKNPDKYM